MTQLELTLVPPHFTILESSCEEQLISAFLAGHRPATADLYGRELTRYLDFLASSGGTPLLRASRGDVARFLRYLEAEGYAAATVAKARVAVRSLYASLVADGNLDSSPAEHVRGPVLPDGPQRLGLEENELARLLSAARRHSPRAEVLVVLLAVVDLRVSEAIGIEVGHIATELGRTVVTVMRKGGRREKVVLSPEVAELVRFLIGRRRRGPLLVSEKGEAMSRFAARRLVAHLGRDACIEAVVYPHLLRHTGVTLAIRAGVPLPVVAAAAGHRDIATTVGYARRLAAEGVVAQQAVFSGLAGATNDATADVDPHLEEVERATNCR